jgi:vancomycin permeability regulator SanA
MTFGARLALVAGAGLTALAAPQIAARVLTAGLIHPVGSGAFAPARAALVLGARVWEDGRPSLVLRQRVEVGAELFHRGLVERVVMSGAGQNLEGLDETAAMRDAALALGVPDAVIDLDPHGVDTGASARNAADLGSVIVCSQEFHLPRAVMLARIAGLDAQGAFPPLIAKPATFIGYGRELPATWKALAEVRTGR